MSFRPTVLKIETFRSASECELLKPRNVSGGAQTLLMDFQKIKKQQVPSYQDVVSLNKVKVQTASRQKASKQRKRVNFGDIELRWYNKNGKIQDQSQFSRKLQDKEELKKQIKVKKIDELKMSLFDLQVLFEQHGNDFAIIRDIEDLQRKIWQLEDNPKQYLAYEIEQEEDDLWMDPDEIAENEQCFMEFFTDGFGTSNNSLCARL